MKILSDFDTKLYDTLKQEYIEKYGRENVMFIKRANIFFWLYIMAPLIILFMFIVLMLRFSFGLTISDPTLQFVVRILCLVSSISALCVWGWKIMKKYFDYTMDFCIISPKELVAYNQSGLFERHTEIIDTEKIKTINKIPQGFFGSVFNFANLVFLSEGDKEIGDISLNFVEKPEETYKKIRIIIESHLTPHH